MSRSIEPTPAQSLTQAQVEALRQGFSLLQANAVDAALRLARQVLDAAPNAAPAHKFLGLCLRRAGAPVEAAAAFETALKLAPRDHETLNSLANVLIQLGRAEDAVARYREALDIAPGHGEAWMNLSLALLGRGELSEALAAAERACALAPRLAPAWRALASARRRAGDLAGGEAALRQALTFAPNDGAAWTALGVLRRLQGDPADALACYARARDAGFASLELTDAEISARLDLGEADAALKQARALAAEAPGYAPGQAMLAQMLWEHGAPDEDPFAAFAAAVEARPHDAPLREAYVQALLKAERGEDALAQARALRASADKPAYAGHEAEALHLLGRGGEADALLEPLRRAGVFPAADYARHALRMGRADAAAAAAQAALDAEQYDQQALALLGTAWRLLDDPREHWLCGYDRFIVSEDVIAPAPYADLDCFIAAISETLTALHTARREPVQQSLRHGTQTSGSLLGRPDPVIAAARDALLAAVERAIARLPKDDPSHPFLARNSGRVRFSGSWSARLRSTGRHVNHFHPQGWLSSAFYVTLPPSVSDETEGAPGCIQFGQPPPEYVAGLAPRRIIKPMVGRLVLFPSYLWHGTLPFFDDAARMTIAFDALPVADSKK